MYGIENFNRNLVDVSQITLVAHNFIVLLGIKGRYNFVLTARAVALDKHFAISPSESFAVSAIGALERERNVLGFVKVKLLSDYLVIPRAFCAGEDLAVDILVHALDGGGD